jgi:hypothetical protein
MGQQLDFPEKPADEYSFSRIHMFTGDHVSPFVFLQIVLSWFRAPMPTFCFV